MRRIQLCLAFILPACAIESDELRDGSFLDDGKADAVAGVQVHGYEADAIVAFLNAAPSGVLANDVGLGTRTTDAIVMTRNARPFATLFDVDRAPYTEQTFFIKTRDWVRANETIGSCGDGIVQPSVETCDGGADCNQCRLATAVELGRFAHGHGSTMSSVALPGGGVAILAEESYDHIVVSQRSATGEVVGTTRFSTYALDPHLGLDVGLDGKLAVTIVGTSVTVADNRYQCIAADGICGYVFTLSPDGRVDAGRVVGENPRLLSLASGDWALQTNDGSDVTLALLDGATLASVWQRTMSSGKPPVGPYLSGTDICSLIQDRYAFDPTRQEMCITDEGDPVLPHPYIAVHGDTYVAARNGIIAIRPDSVRAATAGVHVPPTIPFATLPFDHIAALDDGSLVLASDDVVSRIDASGQLAWQQPTYVRGLAVTSGVVAARSGTETILFAP